MLWVSIILRLFLFTVFSSFSRPLAHLSRDFHPLLFYYFQAAIYGSMIPVTRFFSKCDDTANAVKNLGAPLQPFAALNCSLFPFYSSYPLISFFKVEAYCLEKLFRHLTHQHPLQTLFSLCTRCILYHLRCHGHRLFL